MTCWFCTKDGNWLFATVSFFCYFLVATSYTTWNLRRFEGYFNVGYFTLCTLAYYAFDDEEFNRFVEKTVHFHAETGWVDSCTFYVFSFIYLNAFYLASIFISHGYCFIDLLITVFVAEAVFQPRVKNKPIGSYSS